MKRHILRRFVVGSLLVLLSLGASFIPNQFSTDLPNIAAMNNVRQECSVPSGRANLLMKAMGVEPIFAQDGYYCNNLYVRCIRLESDRHYWEWRCFASGGDPWECWNYFEITYDIGQCWNEYDRNCNY